MPQTLADHLEKSTHTLQTRRVLRNARIEGWRGAAVPQNAAQGDGLEVDKEVFTWKALR